MTTSSPCLIEIFRAGRHTDMHGRALSFSVADLEAIAAGYDPVRAQAPVVIGHPQTDAPAYAQVKRLVVQGDALAYEEEQADSQFDVMRRDGRFKQRSASFFAPHAPNNPTPGKYYLKHVGWLGAAAPAVAGLKPAAFAGDEHDTVEFAMSDHPRLIGAIADVFRGIREWLIATNGVEKADTVVPQYQIDSLSRAADEDASEAASAFAASDLPPSTAAATEGASNLSQPGADAAEGNAALAEREAQLVAREARIREDEQRLAERRGTERRDEAVAFADGLLSQGRLLPKDRAAIVELLLALPTEAPLSFANGDNSVEAPAGDLMRAFLTDLPVRIDFAEKAGGGNLNDTALSFTAPAGASVTADRLELHSRAKAYQAEHPGTSFLAAAQAVGG